MVSRVFLISQVCSIAFECKYSLRKLSESNLDARL
uniref:Uncharacterized protein n=1 Tax=Anguilla anguilla TaxID=7936 RepID=A0A0E9PH58_ANGAN